MHGKNRSALVHWTIEQGLELKLFDSLFELANFRLHFARDGGFLIDHAC